MQYTVTLWLYGGGDIFSAKRSNPCSMQDAVTIWLYDGGDIFSAKTSYPSLHIQYTVPHSMQWMQYTVHSEYSGYSAKNISTKRSNPCSTQCAVCNTQ